ncbi:MAG: tetratricopeptide repeat protein [Elusimicrobia bacterium]|nr:tetratricopeptide repeat protein [Elusimicrobiota bacterium]
MRRRLLLLTLLLLPVTAVYLPVFEAGYTNWDDPYLTYNNPLVKDLGSAELARAFTAPRLGNYHPLADLSLALESAALGERAAVHHAGNLLLHLANSALVFLLLAALLGADLPALAGALLWALHPAQAESAAWLAERKNLLYAFFYFSALLAYLRARAGGRRTALTAGLFLAALFSKGTAVTLPLALLALDWKEGRPLDRANLLEKAGLLALAGAFTAVAAAAQAARGTLLPASFTGLFSFYAMKAAWPAGLSALYPYKATLAAIKAAPLRYSLPAAIFAGALGLAVRRGARTAAFGLLFFFVNILPFTLLIPIGPALAADRYLYLPLAGLAAALLAALAPAWRSARPVKLAAGCLLAALIFAEAALAAGRVKIWRSSETLWNSVLAASPSDEIANLNLAQALLERGDLARALPRLQAALEANPSNADALYNLGTALARAGRPAEALAPLRKAAFLKPESAPAWNNRGLASLAAGRRAEAHKAFLMALETDPAYAPARGNLAALERIPARR